MSKQPITILLLFLVVTIQTNIDIFCVVHGFSTPYSQRQATQSSSSIPLRRSNPHHPSLHPPTASLKRCAFPSKNEKRSNIRQSTTTTTTTTSCQMLPLFASDLDSVVTTFKSAFKYLKGNPNRKKRDPTKQQQQQQQQQQQKANLDTQVPIDANANTETTITSSATTPVVPKYNLSAEEQKKIQRLQRNKPDLKPAVTKKTTTPNANAASFVGVFGAAASIAVGRDLLLKNRARREEEQRIEEEKKAKEAKAAANAKNKRALGFLAGAISAIYYLVAAPFGSIQFDTFLKQQLSDISNVVQNTPSALSKGKESLSSFKIPKLPDVPKKPEVDLSVLKSAAKLPNVPKPSADVNLNALKNVKLPSNAPKLKKEVAVSSSSSSSSKTNTVPSTPAVDDSKPASEPTVVVPVIPNEKIDTKKSGVLQLANLAVITGVITSLFVGNIDEMTDTEQKEFEKKQAEEEEARRKAAVEKARKRAEEEEARKKAEAEERAKKKAEEEAKQKAEEEAKQKAALEAKQKAQEKANKRALEEVERKSAEAAKRKAEEEARKKAAEQALKQAEEEARQKIAQEARRAFDAKQKAAEEKAAEARNKARKQRMAEEERLRKKEEREERRRAAKENAPPLITVACILVGRAIISTFIGTGLF